MLKEKKHKKRINMIVANLVRLTLIIAFIIGCVTGDPVSYTHLDVYKRQ